MGRILTLATLLLLLAMALGQRFWEHLVRTRGTTRRREILLDCLLLFVLASIYLAPYYKHKYTDQWQVSIESTFISDVRFLAAHWPHPQCGNRCGDCQARALIIFIHPRCVTVPRCFPPRYSAGGP